MATTINVIVAALGSGAEDAEPFFGAAWDDELRDDWEGEIGISIVPEVNFAVASLGRYVRGRRLAAAAEVSLWSAERREKLASVSVGPASKLKAGFAYQPLETRVVLRAGREYRLTQRCERGMPDLWPNGFAYEDEVSEYSYTEMAKCVGGVYDFMGGYPSFEDAALRRAGMVNFEIAPAMASVDIEPSATVAEMKRRLEEVTGMPPLQQRLLHGSAELPDGAMLAAVGVRDGAYLELGLRSGAFVATAASDGHAALWCASSGDLIRRFEGHAGAVLAVAFSPSCGHMASASEDGTARLWDTESGECVWVMQGHCGAVRTVSFSPVSPLVLSGAEDATAALWDTERRERCAEFCGHTGAVVSATFSPDGHTVATASLDGCGKLWRVDRRSFLCSLIGHQGSVLAAEFSLDSARVLTTSVDEQCPVTVWRADDGVAIQSFSRGMPVREARLSPDGGQVLTACADHVARLWQAELGDCLLELPHDGQVCRVRFSLDCSLATTVGGDLVVRVWRLADCACIHELAGHSTDVDFVGFLPDGIRLATASGDGEVRMWELDHGACEWHRPAAATAPARLSCAAVSP